MRVVALLVAAGRGQRFGTTEPKQFLALAGRPVLRHAAEALLADGLVEAVLPVCSAGEEGRVSTLLDGLPILPPVQGGIALVDAAGEASGCERAEEGAADEQPGAATGPR